MTTASLVKKFKNSYDIVFRVGYLITKVNLGKGQDLRICDIQCPKFITCCHMMCQMISQQEIDLTR